VLTAVVIASAVEPAARWFARYKVPRVPAVILVYACAVLVFAGVFYFFVPPLLDEASRFTSALPQYLEATNVERGSIVSKLPEIISLRELVEQAKETFSGVSGSAFEMPHLWRHLQLYYYCCYIVLFSGARGRNCQFP